MPKSEQIDIIERLDEIRSEIRTHDRTGNFPGAAMAFLDLSWIIGEVRELKAKAGGVKE
jgi:hypothetical protein